MSVVKSIETRVAELISEKPDLPPVAIEKILWVEYLYLNRGEVLMYIVEEKTRASGWQPAEKLGFL